VHILLPRANISSGRGRREEDQGQQEGACSCQSPPSAYGLVLVAFSPQQANPTEALQHLQLKCLPEEQENVGEERLWEVSNPPAAQSRLTSGSCQLCKALFASPSSHSDGCKVTGSVGTRTRGWSSSRPAATGSPTPGTPALLLPGRRHRATLLGIGQQKSRCHVTSTKASSGSRPKSHLAPPLRAALPSRESAAAAANTHTKWAKMVSPIRPDRIKCFLVMS